MTTIFHAYLDFNEDGACMAHILDLPGCFVRADNRELALLSLPTAMEGYQAWLRSHGEDPEPLPADFEIEVVAEVTGEGGLHRGGRVGLFEPEKEPVSAAEVTSWLRLAAYNREELLTLVGGWPDSLLGWRPSEDEMSIHDVLVHIGDADGIYVTRILRPTPAIQRKEAGMDWRQYLAVQREAAITQLRNLSEEERSWINVPDDHEGDESWTVRKVLRRMVEHEREHMAHIHEILGRWSQAFWVRLTAERSQLLWDMRSLSEEQLTTIGVEGDWTVKDILVHIGWWDLLQARRLALLASGRLDKGRDVPEDEVTYINQHVHDEYGKMAFEQALAFFLKERGSFKAGLKRLAEYEWHEPLVLGDGSRVAVREWAERRCTHDSAHSHQLAKWRDELPKEERRHTGPLPLLTATFQASRRALLAVVDWVPDGERTTRLVCGEWNLKDVLGHVTDWEAWGVQVVRDVLATGKVGESDFKGDIQAWNEARAAERFAHSWDRVWADFEETRNQLMGLLGELTAEQLNISFMAPWQQEMTVYRWLLIWLEHERYHAGDLRSELAIPGVAKRLLA
ncbi:MAG TPA: DinB family protein [Anaerolineae bacterium]|nr:DinB family protein [Anaerolineae bacterium]